MAEEEEDVPSFSVLSSDSDSSDSSTEDEGLVMKSVVNYSMSNINK